MNPEATLPSTAGLLSAAAVVLALSFLPETDSSAAEAYVRDGAKGSVPVFTCRIIRTYPHDRESFTQGLVFASGFLLEGTGLYGRSSLRKVELETGRVLQRVDLPGRLFGEGIAVFGGKIAQLTWKSGRGLVYDLDTLELQGEFGYDTEGWGLAYDGERLVMSDGTSILRYLDPTTFEEVGRLDVRGPDGPVGLLNELEYFKGEILANVWRSSRIARISPATGMVVGWIDLRDLPVPDGRERRGVANGIAYDAVNERLFLTGKRWPVLFEVELVPSPAPQ